MANNKSNQRVPNSNNNVATKSNQNKMSSENTNLVPSSETSNTAPHKKAVSAGQTSQPQNAKICFPCDETCMPATSQQIRDHTLKLQADQMQLPLVQLQ